MSWHFSAVSHQLSVRGEVMKRIHHVDMEAPSRRQPSAIRRQPKKSHRFPPVDLPHNPQCSPLNSRPFLFSPCHRVSVVNLLLLVALMTLAEGCSPSPPPTPKTTHKHAHGHPHEHAMTHEEEHGILPHKPHTFEEAVSEIERRGRALIADRDKPPTQVTEWFDILGWLPELAGDTELKRADWEQAVRIAKDIESWSGSWKPSSSAAAAPDTARFESLIVELRQVLSRLPPPR